MDVDAEAVKRWWLLREQRERELLDQLAAPAGRSRPIELLARRRRVDRIVGLATYGSDLSVPLMSEYLHSPVRRYRSAAAFVLGKSGSPMAIDAIRRRESYLLDRLPAAASKRARLDLFSDLRLVVSDASVSRMRDYMFSDELDCRVAAINTLGAIGSPLATAALLDALPGQNSEGIGAIACSLRRNDLLTPERLPLLIDCLDRRGDQLDVNAKLDLMVALRSAPHPSEVSVLAALVGDEDKRVQRCAAISLKRLGTAEAAVALRAAIEKLPRGRGRVVRKVTR